MSKAVGSSVTPEQVFTFISDYIAEHGISPNLREISAHFNIGHATAISHLIRLEERGKIRRRLKVARGISIMPGVQI